jgi:hypothetical protein
MQLLYDFDYESDRLALVQALLLLTYYYETPDDQKDTWHWMGVATSVAHTIGLHRNPEKTNMDPERTKLWKRIWWSTYMRDRLIALGMRRPTRIKTEDYDVPMLTIDDFEIAPLPDSVACIPADCAIARDVELQRQLAVMCIEKAKLCLCVSHVLSKQYCVLNNQQSIANDRTTMMLLPKKLDPETCEVKACDRELQRWIDGLPAEARYSENSSGNAAVDLHRALLQMVFYTTLSALHRPQVLPSAITAAPSNVLGAELLETSRRNVRLAATAITSIAAKLDQQDLVKYLPTTGVTVLLPAIIIHLLDIKAPDEETRRKSLRGFCQCMQVMGKLRDLYAAADYSTAFLEAAIRKAGINIPTSSNTSNGLVNPLSTNQSRLAPARSVEDLVDAGRRLDMANNMSTISMFNKYNARTARTSTLTPPPESRLVNPLSLEQHSDAIIISAEPLEAADSNLLVTEDEMARRLESFLASTPPDSDHHSENSSENASSQSDPTQSFLNSDSLNFQANNISAANTIVGTDLLFANFPTEFDEGDFDSLLNMDAVGGESGFSLSSDVTAGAGSIFGRLSSLETSSKESAGFSGEGSGFAADVDWMKIAA